VRRSVAALALALGTGCVRAPPADLSRDPAGLLEQVREGQARVRSVRGSARLDVTSEAQSGTLDAYLEAEKPARVRIELLDFFGNPAALLVANEGRFGLYDARAGVYYRGEATAANLARLLPFPLPVEDVAVLLCGSAPLPEGSAASAEPDGSAMRLEVLSPRGREILRIGAGATVRSATLEPTPGSGSAGWRVSFDVFRTRGGALVPSEADLRAGRARVAVRWKSDLEVNPASEGAPFQLDAPRGARVVDLTGPPPPLDLPLRGAESAVPER